ncbi:MAG TPA: EAL domain-containing protein [Steroidobacteraceae bacterium]|nr:EAL domain-containing protein [Steroidobacteraceae bacterium]
MSLIVVGIILLAALVALTVVNWLQRRELKAVGDVSQQLQRIAIGGHLGGRVQVGRDGTEAAVLTTAVNHLLTRAASGGERGAQLFDELADRIHEAVLVHRDTIVHANRQFAALLGLERASLAGRRLDELVTQDYAGLVRQNLARRLAGEAAAERYEIEIKGPAGLTRLEVTTSVIDYGSLPALLVTGVEVVPTSTMAALRPAEAAPSRAATRRALALDSLAEAIVTTDEQGAIDYMNPAAAALMRADPQQALGRQLGEVCNLVDEVDRRALADPVRQALAAAAGTHGKRALLLARGGAGAGESSVELSAAPIRNGGPDALGTVVLLHDVTEQRGQVRRISYQATHDGLTGLVNRGEFERRLGEAAEGGRRGEGQHVLCYLDLDRFKAVNDTSGHLAGDSMLREVAKLLRDAVRDSDTVARLGGDEFGMLLTRCPLEKARQIADDVCRAINDYRFIWKDRVFNVGASIGLVEIAHGCGTIEELIACADAACYVAKKEGAGRVVVYSAREEAVARQSGEIHWLQKLQAALKENRFRLYLQAIVPAQGESAGPRLEVLVRLRDDAGLEVLPAEFMRAAEQHRLMRLVDRWVVQATLTALGAGAIALAPEHAVAINISGQTLGDAQFLEFVVECLDRTGVRPTQLCFELSEASVAANPEQVQRFVGVLHSMGCLFAIDDFGSGIGSFSNLKNLPLDYLKLDGSLTHNLAGDTVNQALVTAMIRLARSLKFKVIAEQVEEPAEAEAVRRMGVDFLQGYAVGKPQPLSIAA